MATEQVSLLPTIVFRFDEYSSLRSRLGRQFVYVAGFYYVYGYCCCYAGADCEAFQQAWAGTAAVDVFGANTYSDESPGQVLDARDTGRDLKLPGCFAGTGVCEYVFESFMGGNLDELRYAGGKFAAALHAGQQSFGYPPFSQWTG